MENGRRAGGRLLQRPKEVNVPLTGNRERGDFRHYNKHLLGWLSCLKMPHADSLDMEKADGGAKTTELKPFKWLFNFSAG